MDQVRRKTNATSAYQRHLTGKGVTVAFLDTGISMHPDLQGRILAFRDFQNGKKYPYDDSGHGTHVAGICCGSGQLSRGQYAGMAPGAGIVSAKVLDYHGNGMREQVLSSVSWILKNKNRYHIKILNVSVGAVNSLEEKNAVLAECMEHAWDAGLVVVVAAGNMGPHAGSVTVPGTNKKVITVGAFDDCIFPGGCYSGRRTDTGMYLQTGDHGSRIKHPILQQHLVSGRQKILYQKRYLHGSTRCLRCDRPASGKRTTSYKRGSENAS